MHEYDWDGDMDIFQDILAKKGITKDMLDMEQFRGCTYDELMRIAKNAYIKRKEEK